MGHSHKQAQPDSTCPLDKFGWLSEQPIFYHTTAVTHSAFNQVSALSEIIFASAVLRLHIVHLTLADLSWR